eukprot:3605739-Prymnesium_polylepis.2
MGGSGTLAPSSLQQSFLRHIVQFGKLAIGPERLARRGAVGLAPHRRNGRQDLAAGLHLDSAARERSGLNDRPWRKVAGKVPRGAPKVVPLSVLPHLNALFLRVPASAVRLAPRPVAVPELFVVADPVPFAQFAHDVVSSPEEQVLVPALAEQRPQALVALLVADRHEVTSEPDAVCLGVVERVGLPRRDYQVEGGVRLPNPRRDLALWQLARGRGRIRPAWLAHEPVERLARLLHLIAVQAQEGLVGGSPDPLVATWLLREVDPAPAALLVAL